MTLRRYLKDYKNKVDLSFGWMISLVVIAALAYSLCGVPAHGQANAIVPTLDADSIRAIEVTDDTPADGEIFIYEADSTRWIMGTQSGGSTIKWRDSSYLYLDTANVLGGNTEIKAWLDTTVVRPPGADSSFGGAVRATTCKTADSTNGGAIRAETCKLADSTVGGAARAESAQGLVAKGVNSGDPADGEYLKYYTTGDTLGWDTPSGSGDVTDVIGGNGLVDDGNTGAITVTALLGWGLDFDNDSIAPVHTELDDWLVTGVTAGSGLTDGGTEGTVTLNVGAGTGITVNANDVEATLGTSIVTGEITDGTITEPDLNESGGAPSDNDLLTYNLAATNFTWVTTLPEANGGTGDTDLDDIIGGTGITVTNGANTIIAGNATVAITAQSIGRTEVDSSDGLTVTHLHRGNSNVAESVMVTIETIEDSLALCHRFGDTLTLAFAILNPEAANDLPLWQTKRAITIISVSAVSTAGTNVVGALQEYNATGTSVDAAVDGDWTITTSEYTDASFTNAGKDAGDWLGWKTTSVSGSVTSVSITFEYTETY